MESFKGKYLCLGVIPTNIGPINHKAENYSKALCVCTDRYYYNMDVETGYLMISEGDVIDFVLDFEKNIFWAKNEQFSFKKEGIKNYKFYPYFGFSKNSYAKIKIIK